MARSLEALFPAAYEAAARRRPIDLVHLAKQTLGDWALECEVMRMFDEVARTYFGRLEASTNSQELLVNLHALKGAASGVGAWGIVDMCKLAEHEVRQGDINPERIDDIAMTVEETRVFIAELLEDEPI
ncbi:hypothetical protein GCM10011321_05240 [Youhaiella tibetensis]|uniref:Hpt domain-containing protein n=1 Tax=Paradevosia tibetensis TaxID=1447062 RepID=A0A5B9DPX7_9HYPH|nr:Hpt domain-containing protein [Youhaiella tibetensis]QEE21287.1 Hpt domain-containing protein [Youhaiella tibetensis]GGF16271.1 hypothetical protein GCM10011321_05240 [Youhaiella tibetensis]